MRIATWNVNSLRVGWPQVLEWLARTPVDVLAMQETKLTDADFPRAELAGLGYQVLASGQKTYNGVALLSRWPCTEVATDIPELADPARRVLAASTGGARGVELSAPPP